ncbi:hypothetical protein [Suttonella ornithocola]|uniref:Periplasmic protein n=1 Tax=Suttonella ornithocola TaxID=279832 RepID=A0A380MV58_9GAMM|nr:hypothetical protein [Suttonella ornithocola]SUO95277.1 Uncharacterised protein [Suttonella ornithocola]
MKKLLLLISALSSFTYAAEIEGAFGYKFGDKVDLNTGKVKQDKGSIAYLNLDKPPKGLEILMIGFAPDTNEIMSLVGLSSYTEDKCDEVAESYRVAIEKKYNEKMQAPTVFTDDTKYILTKNNKEIRLECRYDFSNDESMFIIYYTDNKREKASKQRTAERDAEKLDSSQL